MQVGAYAMQTYNYKRIKFMPGSALAALAQAYIKIKRLNISKKNLT